MMQSGSGRWGLMMALAVSAVGLTVAADSNSLPAGAMTLPANVWTKVADVPADPLGRELDPGRGAFWCFEPDGGRFLRFGGYTPTECNALWSFELPARRWENPMPVDYSWPAPTNRPGAGAWWSMAWDGKRKVAWLSGGSGLIARKRPELINDIWKYDPATQAFTPMQAKGFPAFSGGCRIAYDSKNDLIVRAPGYDGEWAAMCNRDKTWVYDPNRNVWEGRGTPGAPKTALAAVWVFDEAAGKAVYLAQDKEHLGETWTFDAALAGSNAWARVETRERPPARVVAGAAYDPDLRQVVICGGVGHPGKGYGYLFRGGGVQLTDTWALDLGKAEWKKLDVGAPVMPKLNGERGPRFEHFCAMAYDSKNKVMVLSAPTVGVWALWRGEGGPTALAALPPAVKTEPAAGPVFPMSPPNPKLVNLAANEWVQLEGGTAIGGGEVPLIYDEATGYCLKYGGCNNGGAGTFASGYGNDLSAYDPATERWIALRWVDPCGPPRPANGCTRSYAHDPGRKVNWFGGGTAGNGLAFSLPADFAGKYENATWRYDSLRDRFELVPSTGKTPHGWDRVVCCFDRANDRFIFNSQQFDPKGPAWSEGGPGLPVMFYTYACYADSLKGLVAIKQEKAGETGWAYKTVLYDALGKTWKDLSGGDKLPVTKDKRNPMTAYDPDSDVVIAILDGKTFVYDVKAGAWKALELKTPNVAEQMTFDRRHKVVLATGAMGKHVWAFRYGEGGIMEGWKTGIMEGWNVGMLGKKPEASRFRPGAPAHQGGRKREARVSGHPILSLFHYSIIPIFLLLPSVAASAGEPAFATKPLAQKDGEKVKITFSVTAPTDVEVAVLGADGAVVRHLAAGVLGAHAPEPLKPGLAQELTWDGRADWGRPTGPGPYRVRVSLGVRPVLERMVGDNPAWLGAIVGLATDPRNGELFVFHNFASIHPDDTSTACSVFGRDGTYVRTVYPWPADLPEEKLAGLKRMELDGRKIPFIYNGELRSLVPGLSSLTLNGPVVTSDGRLVLIGHEEYVRTITRYNNPGIKRALVIQAADGGMPVGGPVRTQICKGSQAPIMLACSPDEKTWYAAGVHEGYADKPKGLHAVWRFGMDDTNAVPFIGDADAPGAGPDRFNQPLDVATDKEGNLYVADFGNNRVAVFKPDGAWVGELKVDGPRRVKVSRKTGALYVVAGDDKINRLSRFASWKDAQAGSTTVVGEFKYPWTARAIMLALDESAEPPVLWFSSLGGSMAKKPLKVLRVEDRGATFGELVELSKLPANDRPALGPVMMLSLDRVRNRLYANGQVWDPATDRFTPGVRGSGGGKGGMGGVGLDGNLYLMGYPHWLNRTGPDLKLLPFPDEVAGKAGKGQLDGPADGSLRLRARGVTADPSGNIYALWQRSDPTSPGNKDPNWLALYTPDGKVKNEKLIDSDTRGVTSPRLDSQGNIYVTLGVRPKGVEVPETFQGRDLGFHWKSKGINTSEMNWYHLMYGSIVKFGPEGGVVRKGAGGVPVGYSYGLETEVKGAKWIFYGASSVPSWRQQYPDTCLCEAAQFDVDEYGRSFFPDALRFRVGMLDTAGNVIGWFGEYANVDSAGPGSRVAKPDIPMFWPDNIAVGNGRVYVGDRLNRRVVVVKLDVAARETCEVK